MKRVPSLSLLIWSVLLSPCNILGGESAVTYTSSNGRFGDNLLTYCKAKWISYKYDIHLFYKPFLSSDQLVLHDIEYRYSKKNNFKRVVKTRDEEAAGIDKKAGILYESSFYFRAVGWPHDKYYLGWFDEPDFTDVLKRCIKPRKKQEDFALPNDVITIAVHVRKGSKGDPPLISEQVYKNNKNTYADRIWPRKFPPDQYYIDQIQRLFHFFKGQPLYVYIFTDYQYPERIAQKYSEIINQPNITIVSRTGSIKEEAYLLQDFFAMTKFDCLIRPCSSFSMVAQLLGDYRVVIYPEHALWEDKKLIIDQVGIITNQQLRIVDG